MAANLPYMLSTGLVSKILNKMAEAQRPERFTLDFLSTKLGFGSGSAKAILPLLKRIGFLRSDGTPTEFYTRFRNPNERGAAMAEAIRVGYKEVFERNEYAQDLTRDKFRDLVVEITGLEKDNRSVEATVGTFFALKAFANFDAKPSSASQPPNLKNNTDLPLIPATPPDRGDAPERVGLNLSYTINLNLPETTNVEVFNAIFRSLKENLLKA